ncbi:Asp-tRNA(Asn)/Glu-tRNA(Gln) amidotransferase subunit GatC [Telmatocola sphagniphila]|uniref:Aspartyl/glutamyl-tRNA(Asn/Gln) amidotransferase subunit C n=1 Tax=Telmatocola sphagniphila TaxID=1123043 RepID=A0A8E6B438_9BACT|nr:Asp-tRNA(Asn)/Glu-tRNA(Gln) amidotransferase subunit GatC [Telmatocola sphagniphila]QVL31815.1 Asp-tRNA(Asn)/Glu-tRNA(Gln) amidotransferase subunit GatC [Telmatocola sphagniphila]
MDLNEVRKVARLARLELSDADLNRMAQQLSNILAYVDQLKELNTDGIEPLAHPLPVQNVFREDVPGESLPVDLALANAPNRVGNFFGVPSVLDPADEPSH